MSTHDAGRTGRLLQNVLVGTLTLILLAIALVLVPGLMPPGLRDALGLGPRHQVLAAASGSYAFEHIQPGTADMPVTYNRCAPLHYVVNLDGAPPNDPRARFVFAAVKRASAASGLRFVYDGPTSETAADWDEHGGPVLIVFAHEADFGDLAGKVDGFGGSSRTLEGRPLHYLTGRVVLEREAFAEMGARPHGEDHQRAVVLHELGHVLGLAHVGDRNEVMYVHGVRISDYGPGDLTGLKILGSGPCL
jgi:hypothetical protein